MTVRKCDAVQETRVTVSRWLRTLVRILSAVLAITGLAAAQADAQDTVLSFDIPSQSLPAALDAFAEQAHVQMLYKADSVSDLQSTPVSGQLSAEQALHHLLQGTGLSFQSGGPNTITVVTPPAEPNHESAPPARDRPRTEKPVKVPEILVKDVQEREGETSYVAEDTKTATKTDIPLIETPQSISVITRARMQAQEVNSIGEALRYTPGVRGEPFGFDSRLTWLQFRGFDNTTNGLFKDGLQLRNPAFGISYNLEPYGAEQLDVLRGPASFLYGQGSPGGLLNYVSKRPTLQSLHEVQFLAGSFGRYEGRFDFGGRINDSDTSSFRMTGLIRESGTQIDNVPNDRVYIAPALTWRMASSTSLTFFATYQKDRAGAFQWLPADGTLGFNPNGFVQPHRFTGQPSVDRYNRTEHSVGYEFHHQLSENWKFLQKMRYNSNETDNVSTYVLGLEPDRRTAIRDQWSSYGKLTAIALDNQISGRLSTGPMQHTLLAGLDFQRISVRHNQNFAEASSVDIFNRYDYGTLGVVPYFDSKQDTKQLQTGVYIQDQIKMFDKWLLTLGGRHDWARNEATDNVAGTTSTQSDRKATGRAALTYLFDNGLAPYFSYSTFFLPSIGIGADGKQFKPESGQQYEAGIKYQIPRTRAFVTAAVFDLTRENYVQTDPGTFLPVQRGKARSRGLELEGVASFDSGWDLIAAYTLLDNKVQETVDPSEQGKRLVQVPAQFSSLWAKYTVPDGKWKGFGIGGGARYTGYNYADTPNAFRVPSYVVGDAVIDHTWNHYRFALNINNILNHNTFGCFNEGLTCNFGERRTVVGSVAYRW
mgnify:FL=1